MFFLFRLKQVLLQKKSLFLFLLLPLLIASLSILAEKTSSDRTGLYRVIIIDQDGSRLSKTFVRKMKSYGELQIEERDDEEKSTLALSRGSCDVIYILHPGFEERLRKGERSRLLTTRSAANDPSVKWLNDQVSLEVMRLWSYQDIYRRIRAFEPSFTEESYALSYSKYPEEHELLKLQVYSEEGLPLSSSENGIGTSVFVTLWLYLFLLHALTSLRRLTEERILGIPERLSFSGIGRGSYLLSSAAIFLLQGLLPLLLSLLLLHRFLPSSGERLPLFFGLSLALLCLLAFWLLFYLISQISKTVLSYMLTSQLLCGLVIIISGFRLIRG